jgi:hypothetical protein
MCLRALRGYENVFRLDHPTSQLITRHFSSLIWSEGSRTADHQGQTANWKNFDAHVAANPTESGNSPWIFVRIRSIGGLINLSILHLSCPIIRVEVYEKSKDRNFQ